MSADSLCTYERTHWICSSTIAPYISILPYNLHTIMNSETYNEAPSNICGFATSVLVVAAPLPNLSYNVWS